MEWASGRPPLVPDGLVPRFFHGSSAPTSHFDPRSLWATPGAATGCHEHDGWESCQIWFFSPAVIVAKIVLGEKKLNKVREGKEMGREGARCWV